MMVLRADPWAPEYGMGFEMRLDEPYPEADPEVETANWSEPIRPRAARPGLVCFVDGVRRVDLRLLADQGEVRAPGLFGTFAVGSVHCDRRATFGEPRIERRVITAGGLVPAAAEVRAGAGSMRFEPASAASLDPDAPLERLQGLMREAENQAAARLVGEGAPLVLVDGPLRLGDPAEGPIVGAVKRFVQRYLEPARERLIGALAPGERTPLFALLDKDRKMRVYSWYTRVAILTGPWHDHAGVMRCEVRASMGADGAVATADRVTALLPAFAGRAADPRTPQNLVPIAGLETWLRHRMGDAKMVRRALLMSLSQGASEGGGDERRRRLRTGVPT